ncbi:hypothetical protein ACS0TY_010809 [Phlomoides rotata]
MRDGDAPCASILAAQFLAVIPAILHREKLEEEMQEFMKPMGYFFTYSIFGLSLEVGKDIAQEFCSVGDDSCLILWDARTGSSHVVKMKGCFSPSKVKKRVVEDLNKAGEPRRKGGVFFFPSGIYLVLFFGEATNKSNPCEV